MKQETLTSEQFRSRYSRPAFKATKVEGVRKGRTKLNESPVKDSIEFGEGWCTITLSGVIKGLNSSGGLMRHWAEAKKTKKSLELRVMALRAPKFPGTVSIGYCRFSSVLMDLDNLASSAKLPLDALKDNKIIVDDSPKYLVSFYPSQEKCRHKDQRVEITVRKVCDKCNGIGWVPNGVFMGNRPCDCRER